MGELFTEIDCRASEDQTFRTLFHQVRDCLVYGRMVYESDGRPDFVFLDVNGPFETLTGLRNLVGARAGVAMPGIQEQDPQLVLTYDHVARTGEPAEFEDYVASLRMRLSISIYCPHPGHFVARYSRTCRNGGDQGRGTCEEDLRALFDDAPLAYHEIDSDGIVVRVNRTECELLGVSAEEMVGRPIWDFLIREEEEEGRAILAQTLLGPDAPAPVEQRFRSRTRGELTLRLHRRLIRDASGRAVGIRTALIDRTETKRLNNRLATERQLLRALMDQTPDEFYVKDREGHYLLVNAVKARHAGCGSPSAMVGKTASDFFRPERAAAIRQEEEDLLAERVRLVSSSVLETRHDGREAFVFTTKLPLRDRAGKIIGTFGISRDLTELRRMEQAFRASEDRLRLAEESLSLGTWELDLAADRSTCSQKLLQLYGLTGEALDGAKWLSSVHPDDREAAADRFREGLRTGETLNRRFRVIWPDGSVHWLHSMSRMVRDAEDHPVRVVGIDFDITELAHTEERLRVLSTAVEQSPVSILITSLDGTIQYVNPKTSEVTGYSEEELIGQNPRLLKSGETSARAYGHLWHTIQSGEWRGVFHNRKKNGELFWESAVIRPIRDASGRPTHYLAVKEDITARRATEEALRISEERFRVAAQNAGDVVFEWDLDAGTFDFLGVPVRERFPLMDAPLNVAEWLRIIHPEDRAGVIAAVERHIADHEPFRQEYRVVQTDNSVIDVAVRSTVVATPQAGKFKSIGVLTDITARKAAERANAELAAIVESAEAAIYSRDLSGKLLTWNAGAERIYGYKAEEMIGQDINILLPADRSRELQAINDAMRGGQRITHMETIRVHKSGEPIPVMLSISPIHDRGRNLIGAAHVVWDISEHKLLQQQLAQAQKLESIGQLAAGIAHEINTPVQYIGDNAQFLSGAFLELLQIIDSDPNAAAVDLPYLRHEVPSAISQMREGVDRVAGIVRAMKRFSHPGPAEKVPLDINQAIESTVLVSRNEWKYVADLVTDFDPTLPLAPCIAGEFNQVILNVIVNAAHAIAEVFQVSRQKGVIRVTTRKAGGFAEIRISDTGGGIPEAIRAKVFDPFFTTKPVGKGTGQGLAIAHAVIVRKHRGSIEFESEIGKGTTFVIRLPLGGGEKEP